MRPGLHRLAWAALIAGAIVGCTETPPAAREPVSRAGPSGGGDLGAAAAREMIAADPEVLVLDVRFADEWDDDLGHIDGARQIPLPDLAGRVGEIEAWKERPVIVVCRVGGRSRSAASVLAAAGFTQVWNLEGGMAAWRRAGY